MRRLRQPTGLRRDTGQIGGWTVRRPLLAQSTHHDRASAPLQSTTDEVIPRDVRTVGRWLGVRHDDSCRSCSLH
jgi:hypothetical protein